jgi:metal-responsive CopG/Arc/MetJ family transcriptional regulator
MKRITVTLPDELEHELNAYLASKDAPPNLTTLTQAALRDYLRTQRLSERAHRPAQKPFSVAPLAEKDAHGEPDVSLRHDAYLADR